MALSDNFETIKDFAAGAAQNAAKKTRQLVTIAKANAAILAQESRIRRAQLELGKLYYKDYAMEEEPDEAEYLPWCDKITEALKSIEQLRDAIAQARAGQEDSAETDDEKVVVQVDPEALEVDDEPAEEAVEEAVEEAAEEAPAEEPAEQAETPEE